MGCRLGRLNLNCPAGTTQPQLRLSAGLVSTASMNLGARPLLTRWLLPLTYLLPPLQMFTAGHGLEGEKSTAAPPQQSAGFHLILQTQARQWITKSVLTHQPDCFPAMPGREEQKRELPEQLAGLVLIRATLAAAHRLLARPGLTSLPEAPTAAVNTMSGWDDSTSTAVIGWISFNCLNESWCATSSYKVVTTLGASAPPIVSNLSYNFPDPCLQSRIPVLSWTTTAVDPHDYQIQIATSSSFSSPIVDEKATNVFGSSNNWAPQCNYCCDIFPYNNISFGGGTYHWRVRVHDSNGTSTWATSTFITKPHCYPYSDFSVSPSSPSIDAVVTFNNNSSCDAGCSSYFWDFGNGITSTTSGSPTTTYSSSGYKTASLKVTDSNGNICTTTKTFYVGPKTPWWREIVPF